MNKKTMIRLTAIMSFFAIHANKIITGPLLYTIIMTPTMGINLDSPYGSLIYFRNEEIHMIHH